ncbi:MAG: flagellar protein FlaG [Gammaproteobacteria bacterium]|nr:flagellar protein FlaG [Gammaproteobacteria bacterium]
MSNEVGILKPGLAQPAQAGPSARLERTSAIKEKPESPNAVEKAAEDREGLQDVVSNLNQLVRDLHRELQFSVDDDSGETVVKVIDRETDEVVRQIPSEEVMRLRKRLEEAAGVIFHDSA